MIQRDSASIRDKSHTHVRSSMLTDIHHTCTSAPAHRLMSHNVHLHTSIYYIHTYTCAPAHRHIAQAHVHLHTGIHHTHVLLHKGIHHTHITPGHIHACAHRCISHMHMCTYTHTKRHVCPYLSTPHGILISAPVFTHFMPASRYS